MMMKLMMMKLMMITILLMIDLVSSEKESGQLDPEKLNSSEDPTLGLTPDRLVRLRDVVVSLVVA